MILTSPVCGQKHEGVIVEFAGSKTRVITKVVDISVITKTRSVALKIGLINVVKFSFILVKLAAIDWLFTYYRKPISFFQMSQPTLL